MAASVDSRWTRSAYPLQVPSKGSSSRSHAAPVSSIEATTSLPNGSFEDSDPVHGRGTWYQASTEDEAERPTGTTQLWNHNLLPNGVDSQNKTHEGSSTAVSTSHRSNSPSYTDGEVLPWSRGVDAAPPSRPVSSENRHQSPQTSNQWSQPRYPLQASFETPSNRRSSTSSSKSGSTLNDEYRQQSPTHSSGSQPNGSKPKTLRRTQRSQRIEASISTEMLKDSDSRNSPTNDPGTVPSPPPPKSQTKHDYPAQSITSGSTSRSAALPSSSDDLGPVKRAYLSQLGEIGTSTSHDGIVDKAARDEEPVNSRQPAPGAMNPSSKGTSEIATKPSALPNTKVQQNPKQDRSWNRQTYPLQAPASIVDLRGSLTPPPSPEAKPHKTSDIHPSQAAGNSAVTASNKSYRRQKYPLQSPASTASLKQPPSSSQLMDQGIKEEDEQPLIDPRGVDLATKTINHWKRQVYPLQSPKNLEPILRSPTPQPPEDESKKVRHSGPVHLPKNIPAVKDSQQNNGHGRTIVLCLDGTGDKFDNDNSNIVHLVSALKKDDPRQVTYYQAGIGTYGEGGLSGGFSAAADMAVGSSLGLHIRDAYHFLMHAYKEGDKICIFSFSRGAYTARCLAGMIHKVGLLPPRNIQQIQFAYEFYANDTPEGWKRSYDFKKTFCIDVNVYFIGCFDSVASVGFIPRTLPLSSTPTNKPRYFRHAMALDERRAKFKPCRHQVIDWDGIKQGVTNRETSEQSRLTKMVHHLPNHKDQDDVPPTASQQSQSQNTHHPNLTDEEYEDLTGNDAAFDTNVLEVWFAGAHADVGGGAELNIKRHKLAQIPLRWMIRQAFECNTGILFNTKVLAEHGLDVHTLWPKYEALNVPSHGPPPSFLEKYGQGLPPKSIRRSKLVLTDKHENGEQLYHLKSHTDEDWTPEQVEDFYDAMCPINDQLVQAWTWWILEFWPVEYKVPIGAGKAYFRTALNLGRYRGVDDAEPNLHWTVLHRMQHMAYQINVRTAPQTRWRTVI